MNQSNLRTVVLVQCTNQKRDEIAPAKHLYDESTYFVKQREYAETADAWYVQSAKHGLVLPNEWLHPYNKHAKDLDQPAKWARKIAAELSNRHGTATVEILGGRAYADPLRPALEARGFRVTEPLDGLGIGERMAELGRMVEGVTHAPLHG